MKKTISACLTGLWMAFACTPVEAQQIPTSMAQRFEPGWFNPGHFPADRSSEVFIAHQQRDVRLSELTSGGDFLHLQSRPQGNRGVFSIGLVVSHDREHTEQRLAICPSISAKIWEGRNARLALGISAGILNWNSNYSKRNIYQLNDPLLVDRNNFLELNAGAGAEFQMENKWLDINAEISGAQLAGNMISEQLEGLKIVPQFIAKGSVQFNSVFNFKIGPTAFFSNAFNDGEASYRTGLADFGLRAEFIRQQLSFNGAYRLDRSALTAGLALGLFHRDTLNHRGKPPGSAQMHLAFSIPMAQNSTFGPSAEIGLDFSLGQKERTRIDTLSEARTFWKAEDWLTEHKVKHLSPNGPQDLQGSSEINGRNVYISYEFPDWSKRYAGETLALRDSLVRSIGYEWIGVDGLLENIPQIVVQEALNPDSSHVTDPENLEALKALSWLEISCHLREDEYGAHFSSDMQYEGEIGYSNPTFDTLLVGLVFDGRDTVLAIPNNRFMSNLELAALKLHVMRKKLEYELQKAFGEEFDITWEGAPLDLDEWRPFIRIKKLRITSNNPNLQAFQVNRIDMKFLRHSKYVPKEEEDGWIMREDEGEGEEAPSEKTRRKKRKQ